MSGINIWGDNSGSGVVSTPFSIAQGGTGANDAAGARTNLSLYSVAEIDSALVLKASITSPTGVLNVPAGTTAQRVNTVGIRYNTTLATWEGFNGTDWGSLGSGSGGGGGTSGGAILGIFYESAQVLTENYTLTTGNNAMCAGPLTISDGITILIPDNSVLTVV